MHCSCIYNSSYYLTRQGCIGHGFGKSQNFLTSLFIFLTVSLARFTAPNHTPFFQRPDRWNNDDLGHQIITQRMKGRIGFVRQGPGQRNSVGKGSGVLFCVTSQLQGDMSSRPGVLLEHCFATMLNDSSPFSLPSCKSTRT